MLSYMTGYSYMPTHFFFVRKLETAKNHRFGQPDSRFAMKRGWSNPKTFFFQIVHSEFLRFSDEFLLFPTFSHSEIHFRKKLQEFLWLPLSRNFVRNFVWIWCSKYPIFWFQRIINTRSFGRTEKNLCKTNNLGLQTRNFGFQKHEVSVRITRSFGSKLKILVQKPEVLVQKPEILVEKTDAQVGLYKLYIRDL
jgi:hypothetical protein